MIALGGNIELKGFDELEYGEILIAKKLVGNYIRVIAENCTTCKIASITLERKGEDFQISVEIETDNKQVHSKVEEDNLFFAMDTALKKALSQLNLKV